MSEVRTAAEARRQALALVDRETRLADWVQKAFQLGAVLLKVAKTTEDEERREAAPHRAWLLRLFETLRLTDRGAVVEGLWRLAEAVSSPRA